jgi:hypothetical protein
MDQFNEAAKTRIRGIVTDRKFKDMFGCSMVTSIGIWRFIDSPTNSFEKIHLLWALNFMKDYGTERQLAAAWNVDTKVYATTVKKMIDVLLFCLPDVNYDLLV